MVCIPLLIKNDIERLGALTQLDSLGISPVSQAFMAVAQEVVELLKQSQSFQLDNINRTEATCDRAEIIMIRAIEPEYRQVMAIELLTAREMEVLQLIVDGHNNLTISRKLYIAVGTVKTHVRNILKKLYVSDRLR